MDVLSLLIIQSPISTLVVKFQLPEDLLSQHQHQILDFPSDYMIYIMFNMYLSKRYVELSFFEDYRCIMHPTVRSIAQHKCQLKGWWSGMWRIFWLFLAEGYKRGVTQGRIMTELKAGCSCHIFVAKNLIQLFFINCRCKKKSIIPIKSWNYYYCYTDYFCLKRKNVTCSLYIPLIRNNLITTMI